MRSSFVARTLALTTLVAACDGGPTSDSQGGAPSTVPIAAQGPERVVVTNTSADPVKTEAVGTTAVGGTVAASQSGAWSVHVDNPSLAVEGSVAVSGGSISAFQAGAWSVAVSEPVAIAPGASVAVSALPPVTIAGTPQVEVAGTASVTVANTPSVTIAGAAQALPVAGSVAVTNLPAVQEVTGTVAIEPRETRWGMEILQQNGLVPLPIGLVLTDVHFTVMTPGEDCFGLLYESVDHGAGVNVFAHWRLADEHANAELHLQTGIAARPHSNYVVQLGVGRHGSCTLRAIWSGYLP